jgi:transglutaminase-like putative cysteine protease
MTPDSARSLRLPAATVLATFLSTLGLDRLIHVGPWLIEITFVAALIGAVGLGLRRVNTPRLLIVPAQIVAVLIALTAILVPHAALAGILPDPNALHALGDLINAGGQDIRQDSAPAPATPGITALLTVSGSGFALVLDLLAVTVRRPVLAGAPILAVFLIPATRLPGGLSWLAFAFSAIGFLVLLGTDGQERLSQWGRTVHRRAGKAPDGSTNTGLTRQIATWAICAALLVPLLVPSIPRLITFNGTIGSGSGTGGTIYLDQSVDISRDLTSTTPVPLLDYQTNAPASQVMSDYLQMSVLTDFDGTAWLPPNKAYPAIPGDVSIPGLAKTSQVAISTVTTTVSVIGNMGFSTVPAPYAVTDIQNAVGLSGMEIDTHTDTMYITDNDDNSRQGAHYTTLSQIPEPTEPELQNATVGHDPIGKDYLSLPTDLQSLLTQDADQVAKNANATTPYEKALALQNYFLYDGFHYSLSVPAADGTSAIESFLKNKTGFCEQFAATMAAMARALGIPAVVAEGFTPGTPQSDGSYQVTTHDAHAWPLLYFDDFGWVRFEPTPTVVLGGRASTPPWTIVPAHASGTGTGAGVGTAVPTTRPTVSPTKAKCANGTTAVQLPRNVGGGGGITSTSDCQSTKPAASAPKQAFSSWGAFGVVPRDFERWFLTGNPAQIAVKLLLLALILLTGAPGLARLLRRRNRRALLRKAAAAGTAGAAVPRPRAAGGGDGDEGGRGGRTGGAGSRFGPGDARRAAAFTAWEELREYATDLGFGWPDSDTPRELAGHLAEQAQFDAQSAAAVGRVTTLVERAVYAPDPEIAPEEARKLPEDVDHVRTALGTAAGRGARLRAALLPSSSLDYLVRRGRRQ